MAVSTWYSPQSRQLMWKCISMFSIRHDSNDQGVYLCAKLSVCCVCAVCRASKMYVTLRILCVSSFMACIDQCVWLLMSVGGRSLWWICESSWFCMNHGDESLPFLSLPDIDLILIGHRWCLSTGRRIFIGRSGCGTDWLVAQAGDFCCSAFALLFPFEKFFFSPPSNIFQLCVFRWKHFIPYSFYMLLCGLGVYSDSDWRSLLSCDVWLVSLLTACSWLAEEMCLL